MLVANLEQQLTTKRKGHYETTWPGWQQLERMDLPLPGPSWRMGLRRERSTGQLMDCCHCYHRCWRKGRVRSCCSRTDPGLVRKRTDLGRKGPKRKDQRRRDQLRPPWNRRRRSEPLPQPCRGWTLCWSRGVDGFNFGDK